MRHCRSSRERWRVGCHFTWKVPRESKTNVLNNHLSCIWCCRLWRWRGKRFNIPTLFKLVLYAKWWNSIALFLLSMIMHSIQRSSQRSSFVFMFSELQIRILHSMNCKYFKSIFCCKLFKLSSWNIYFHHYVKSFFYVVWMELTFQLHQQQKSCIKNILFIPCFSCLAQRRWSGKNEYKKLIPPKAYNGC